MKGTNGGKSPPSKRANLVMAAGDADVDAVVGAVVAAAAGNSTQTIRTHITRVTNTGLPAVSLKAHPTLTISTAMTSETTTQRAETMGSMMARAHLLRKAHGHPTPKGATATVSDMTSDVDMAKDMARDMARDMVRVMARDMVRDMARDIDMANGTVNSKDANTDNRIATRITAVHTTASNHANSTASSRSRTLPRFRHHSNAPASLRLCRMRMDACANSQTGSSKRVTILSSPRSWFSN